MLSLQVRTVSKVLIDEHVEWVSFLMEEGPVTIYPGHEAIMGQALEGSLQYKSGKETKNIEISKGFAHVTNEAVIILI